MADTQHYTFRELAIAAGVGLGTAWRFFQDQEGKSVYVKSWKVKKRGGDPSPLICKIVYGDEESCPRPEPKNFSERSTRYRVRKHGLKPVTDPVLFALTKKL